MKNKIAKIAVVANIAGLVALSVICIIGKVVGLESKAAEYVLISLFAACVFLPPPVIAVSYMLGAEAAGYYMIVSAVASLVFNLILAVANSFTGWNIISFPVAYTVFYLLFVIFKNRKKIKPKTWINIACAVFAGLLVFAAETATKIIKDSDVYKYDEQGNLISDGDASYEYADGKLVKRKSAKVTTFYEYDKNGNKILAKDVSNTLESEEIRSTWKYDEKNQLIEEYHSWQKGAAYYSYNDDGQKVKKIEADGKEITYAYDESGKLIAETDSDGKTATYEYNEAGKLVKEVNLVGIIKTYEYNENGTLRKETYCDERYTHTWEYYYFEDEPDKKQWVILTSTDGLGYEESYDRNGEEIMYKTKGRTTYYIRHCTHWKNGNIKTERIYKIRLGR
ncbi:MAG: hypothetical protein II973_00375 [Spirochaetaceae bacterium]|nr:hypothetical protein [Spirochaetaceae bacterium]